MTEPHDHHHHEGHEGHDHPTAPCVPGGEADCADDHTAMTGQDQGCGAGHCHDDHGTTAS
ncbi:hypothetical protein [Nonomuraea sp. NPDC052265]|uniref:hypothetical protein n=1 Tax=Nonomuraea sp. NPDC052265 TaxID=3364374 RepID=UPI0037CA4CEA